MSAWARYCCPSLRLFFPVEQAIALTAIVHFLNGVFKVGLIGRDAKKSIVLTFGLPAVVVSAGGAWLLVWLSRLKPLLRYSAFGYPFEVMPIKLVVRVLLLVFGVLEMSERSFGPKSLPIGGLSGGFFCRVKRYAGRSSLGVPCQGGPR